MNIKHLFKRNLLSPMERAGQVYSVVLETLNAYLSKTGYSALLGKPSYHLGTTYSGNFVCQLSYSDLFDNDWDAIYLRLPSHIMKAFPRDVLDTWVRIQQSNNPMTQAQLKALVEGRMDELKQQHTKYLEKHYATH